MGKDLPKTKKWPCEVTYQKFHSRILVLGISLLPSALWIGSTISTKIPSAHLRLI
jgi:hypothetical protein